MRTRNMYCPHSPKPFKLSRSKIDYYRKCPRCFWLDRVKGVNRPGMPGWALNSAVDELFKKEFDLYRETGKPHPLMEEYGIDAVPFPHAELDKWRANFTGMQVPWKNFILFGAVDDVWVKPDGTLIIADYKSTSKNGEIDLEDKWKIGYKRQMEFYIWLFRQAGFKVDDTGYFVYTNGLKSPGQFGNCLHFKTVMLPWKGDTSWIEPCLQGIKDCLDSPEIPEAHEDCELCNYVVECGNVCTSLAMR